MKISDCMGKNSLFELRVNVLQGFSLGGQRFIQQSIAPFPGRRFSDARHEKGE
jgi:hypothetical protein